MKNEEKIIILGEKCPLDKKEREKGLRVCGQTVKKGLCPFLIRLNKDYWLFH